MQARNVRVIPEAFHSHVRSLAAATATSGMRRRIVGEANSQLKLRGSYCCTNLRTYV